MKILHYEMSAGLALALFAGAFLPIASTAAEAEWISLFDGKTLKGWKASENPDSITVVDGMIHCDGPRAHLFYLGEDGKATFENFELSVDVKATSGANSGVYFHTVWQDEGWPDAGFESQVNNTQLDYHNYVENKKTASLYGFRNTYKALVRDNEWFTMNILVRRPVVETRLNGRLVVHYVEPANIMEGSDKRLGTGRIALQGHDEFSEVFYRNIRIRKLPAGRSADVEQPEFTEQDFERLALGRENFPILDLNTVLKAGETVDDLTARWRTTGIFAGIVGNTGEHAPVFDNASAMGFLKTTNSEPVLAGLRVGEPGWTERYPVKTLAMFDYVMADAAQPGESNMTDNEIVDRVVGMIENLPIDILANPTWLPADKASNASAFWTEERMQQVVDAAVRNGVAFEINIVDGTPSEAFIHKAKTAGARFTIGTGNLNGADPDDWSHLFKVQAAVKLAWRDMFVPGHLPGRAQ